MLLQRKVFDGVDTDFASSQFFLVRNGGDPPVQVVHQFLNNNIIMFFLFQLKQPSEQASS